MPQKKPSGKIISSKSTLQSNRKYTIDEVQKLPNGNYMTTTAINRNNPDVIVGRTKHSFISSGKKSNTSIPTKSTNPKDNERIQRRLEKMAFGSSLHGLNEKQLKELQKREVGFSRDPVRKQITNIRDFELKNGHISADTGMGFADAFMSILGFKN